MTDVTPANKAAPAVQSPELLVPRHVIAVLPAMVKSELAKLPAQGQQEFLEEFDRKSRGLGVAYLCSLLYCHYGYLGRWGMTAIIWIAAIITFGIAGLIWWFIDLIRMPSLVRNHNSDIALEVLRNYKSIHH